MVETNEGEATRLLESPDGLVAATGDMGKLFRLADVAGASGSYESPVHDSGSVARWGRISWRSCRAARFNRRRDRAIPRVRTKPGAIGPSR